MCRSGHGPPVDNAISLGQSICTGKLWQLLKMKIREALIVARRSAIWREAFISQNRLDDAAQPYHQALNTLDSRAFHLGGVQKLHRLFDELELRERAMIVCDALPGMRRRELMGPQWCDLNFLEMLISIVRAVVDQVVGNCKTEVSRKLLSWMITLQALMAWRQESTYTAPTDWVLASLEKKGRELLWLATVMRYYILPAARRGGIDKRVGWHAFGHTFSTLIKSVVVWFQKFWFSLVFSRASAVN